jgi:chorismate synthase
MAGSTYGNIFRISTWGESHGKALGVVVDGVPAGIELSENDIQIFLDRRKPGQSKYTTQRNEDDQVEIMSGVFEGKTTGTPVSMIVRNKDHRSTDYSQIASYYRPGHADYTFDEKFGFRDYRGGGRSSGRETIGRVAAGAIAAKILHALGISITTYSKSIGNVTINYDNFDKSEIMNNAMYMPDSSAATKASEILQEKMSLKDSVGGVIECLVDGMPTGIGEPVFDKLDANLSKAIMSIGAIKGVEIGDGFAVAGLSGSSDNDSFQIENGKVIKVSNHAGGIMGGISDGSQIVLRAAVKPTPSIAQTQQTVNKHGENIEINIKGRHDPIIVPRAVVVVESMVAVTLVDMLFNNMTSKIDKIIDFYK